MYSSNACFNILSRLYLLIGICFIFTGCIKKEVIEAESEYYIRFKEDGTMVEIPGALATLKETGFSFPGVDVIVVNATKGVGISTANLRYLSVGLGTLRAPIRTGVTYDNDYDIDDDLANVGVGLNYRKAEDIYSEVAAVISFTEITDKYVKGTFSGVIENDDSPGSPVIAITEGVFYAEIK